MLNLFKSNKEKGKGLFSSLGQAVKKTRDSLTSGLGTIFLGRKVIDQALFEELETQLLIADVGIEVTQKILADLTKKVSRKELQDPAALFSALKQSLLSILQQGETRPFLSTSDRPAVILMIGVNGSGKTTSIGKLAHYFLKQDQRILLAAGDTFRAAAIEQLQAWGSRNDVPVIAQHSGADSASVIFDAYQAAMARQVDILIADTAGRLHTQQNLMEELKKIKRVMGKISETAPHETLLVLDATTGQNALRQAEEFSQALGVTGIIITKLDGTAKGGILFAIAQKLNLPIYFIGVGEKMDDLLPFQPEEFVDALFEGSEVNS